MAAVLRDTQRSGARLVAAGALGGLVLGLLVGIGAAIVGVSLARQST